MVGIVLVELLCISFLECLYDIICSTKNILDVSGHHVDVEIK